MELLRRCFLVASETPFEKPLVPVERPVLLSLRSFHRLAVLRLRSIRADLLPLGEEVWNTAHHQHENAGTRSAAGREHNAFPTLLGFEGQRGDAAIQVLWNYVRSPYACQPGRTGYWFCIEQLGNIGKLWERLPESSFKPRVQLLQVRTRIGSERS